MDSGRESILSVWQWQWGHLLGKVAVGVATIVRATALKYVSHFVDTAGRALRRRFSSAGR